MVAGEAIVAVSLLNLAHTTPARKAGAFDARNRVASRRQGRALDSIHGISGRAKPNPRRLILVPEAEIPCRNRLFAQRSSRAERDSLPAGEMCPCHSARRGRAAPGSRWSGRSECLNRPPTAAANSPRLKRSTEASVRGLRSGSGIVTAANLHGSKAGGFWDRNIRHRTGGHAAIAPSTAGAARPRHRRGGAATIDAARAMPRPGRRR